MKINDTDIDINKALDFANVDNIILKRQNNRFLLSDYQIEVLKRNEINFEKYGSIQALLFDIEETLNDNYDDELDLISSQLAEYIYYKDTKK